MAALTEDLARKFKNTYDVGDAVYPVKAAAVIHTGAALVKDKFGLISPVNAADPDDATFAGFAAVRVDNALGEDKAIQGKVYERGTVRLTVAGSAASADGTAVFATTDNDFTVTATDNLSVGILRMQTAAGSTDWWVEFEAGDLRAL